MDETRINATINALVNQRNDALNQAAQATAEAEVLRRRVFELEQQAAERAAKVEAQPLG
jgi:hypothetical protein